MGLGRKGALKQALRTGHLSAPEVIQHSKCFGSSEPGYIYKARRTTPSAPRKVSLSRCLPRGGQDALIAALTIAPRFGFPITVAGGIGSLVHVRASKALLAPLQIQHVDPQPAQWGVGPSGPEMAFRVSPATGERTVELEIEPGAVGLFDVSIAAGKSPPVTMHELVLP